MAGILMLSVEGLKCLGSGFLKKIFIYLTVPGLSCGTPDL